MGKFQPPFSSVAIEGAGHGMTCVKWAPGKRAKSGRHPKPWMVVVIDFTLGVRDCHRVLVSFHDCQVGMGVCWSLVGMFYIEMRFWFWEICSMLFLTGISCSTTVFP